MPFVDLIVPPVDAADGIRWNAAGELLAWWDDETFIRVRLPALRSGDICGGVGGAQVEAAQGFIY
jgi:hypothetical protein